VNTATYKSVVDAVFDVKSVSAVAIDEWLLFQYCTTLHKTTNVDIMLHRDICIRIQTFYAASRW